MALNVIPGPTNVIPGRPGIPNQHDMKKIIYILFSLLVIAGCGKNKESKLTLEEKLYGEWHSSSLSVGGDVYLHFGTDRTFEMYQKIGSGAYRLYRGSWNLENDILSGKYNDGESWAAAYDVAIEGTALTLTSVNDAAEVTKYSACSIPKEVRQGCEVVVKSSEAGL